MAELYDEMQLYPDKVVDPEAGPGPMVIQPVVFGAQQMFGQDWSLDNPVNQIFADEGDEDPKDVFADAAQLELDLGLHPAGSADAIPTVVATPPTVTATAPPPAPSTPTPPSAPVPPVPPAPSPSSGRVKTKSASS